MGELFAEEKNLQENICSIRIYVKEYGLLKIESLVLHTEDKIADLSNEILENYLNET